MMHSAFGCTRRGGAIVTKKCFGSVTRLRTTRKDHTTAASHTHSRANVAVSSEDTQQLTFLAGTPDKGLMLTLSCNTFLKHKTHNMTIL